MRLGHKMLDCWRFHQLLVRRDGLELGDRGQSGHLPARPVRHGAVSGYRPAVQLRPGPLGERDGDGDDGAERGAQLQL